MPAAMKFMSDSSRASAWEKQNFCKSSGTAKLSLDIIKGMGKKNVLIILWHSVANF